MRTGLDIKSCPQVKTSASRLDLQLPMPQTDSIAGAAGAATHTLRVPRTIKQDHQGQAMSFAQAKAAQRAVPAPALGRAAAQGKRALKYGLSLLMGGQGPLPSSLSYPERKLQPSYPFDAEI